MRKVIVNRHRGEQVLALRYANDQVAIGFAKDHLLRNAELAVTALSAASAEVAKLTVKLEER